MTIYGYVRVSTSDKGQTTENQKLHMIESGFAVDEFVSEDGISGTTPALKRPAFQEMMKSLVKGDTVICTMVDRLGRNAADVLTIADIFKAKGIKLRVVQLDGIDLTSPVGKMMLGMLACGAEMERNILSERTCQGLKRAKAEGKILGQPLKISPEVLEEAIVKKNNGETLRNLSVQYSVQKDTLQKTILKWQNNVSGYRLEWDARKVQYNK